MNYRPRSPIIFRYLTIQDLRDVGITVTQLDDVAALRAIEQVSQFVNELTDQWFSPVYVVEYLDGRNHRQLALPNLINILEVETLNFKSGGSAAFILSLIEKQDFDIAERWLDRTPSQGRDGLRAFPNIRNSSTTFSSTTGSGIPIRRDFRWSSGSAPYRLTGYFGNLKLTKDFDPIPKKILTSIITSTLVAGNTSMEVADTTDIEIGDSLLIDQRVSVIVNSITPTSAPAGTITFDACRRGAEIGVEVVTFGPVHDEIRRAVKILVSEGGVIDFNNGTGASSGTSNKQARLISERTDNYSYKLSEKGNNANSGSGNRPTSGNLEVDHILNNFMAPPYIGVV